MPSNNAYSQPLHISSFNLDEFEQALRHSLIDPPCNLIAEIHSTLIYNLRTVPFTRHSAVVSLLDLRSKLGGDHRVLGVTLDDLTSAAADIGNNWERAPLRHAEGREGWEESLVGCLKDVRLFDLYLRRLNANLGVFSMPTCRTSHVSVKF